MNDIMVLPETEKELEAVFIGGANIDPVLDVIREQIKNLPLDMSIRKNRDERASFAFKIAKSKVAVDKAGAEISAKYKEIPKKIDANRREYKAKFEAEQQNARAPLDEWERNEQARIDAHQSRIDRIVSNTAFEADACAVTLQTALAMLFGLTIDESWEEFEPEAHRVKQTAVEKITAQLAARKVYESEQAELAKLRADAEARAKADHEAKIAEEAANAARIAAEQLAADKIKEAERAAAQAKQDLELAEQRRINQEKQAALDKAAAESLALERVEMARESEAKRNREAQDRLLAEQQAREADKKHMAAINRAALSDLIDNCDLLENQAKAVVKAIAEGLISNVKINY